MFRGVDAQDVHLQVALAALLYKKTGEHRFIAIMTERLSKLQKNILMRLSKTLKRVNLDAALVSTELKKQPISAGSVILAACVYDLELDMEMVSKWLGDNASTLNSVAIKAIAIYLKRVPEDIVRKALVPVLNRLLLRSSSLALEVLGNLVSGLSCKILLGELGESFWTLLCAENDENRAKAKSILVQVGEPAAVITMIEKTWNGKSIKAKKTMMTTLRTLLKSDQDFLAVEGVLRTILAKESNEEVMYSILCCTRGESVLSEGLKQTKSSIRATYLAALCGDNVDVELIRPILARKESTSAELLATLLSLAGRCSIDEVVLKNALSHSGCLGEKNVVDCLGRYPLLPVARLVKFFSYKVDTRALWKTIVITLDLISHSQLRDVFEELDKITVPVDALAEVMADTVQAPKLMGQLALRAAKTLSDLLELIKVANTEKYSDLKLWEMLVKRIGNRDKSFASGDAVLAKILTIGNKDLLPKIIKVFPSAVPHICEWLVTNLVELAKVQPNEEYLRILNATDGQLPIIDVVTPIKRMQEAAAKRDPKAKLTPSIGNGMSKAEKAAFDIEVERERAIKAELESWKERVSNMAAIAGAIADCYPRLMEVYLGNMTILYRLSVEEWIESEMAALFYQLARCCHPPIGRHGPILASTWYQMLKPTLIDREWHIPQASDMFAALARHLEGISQGASTFHFALPVCSALLEKAGKFGLDDAVVQSILGTLAVNFEAANMNSEEYHQVLVLLKELSCIMPGVSQAISSATTSLVRYNHVQDINVDLVASMLMSSMEPERRFGLFVVGCLTDAYKAKLEGNGALKLGIVILESDANLGALAKRTSEGLYGQVVLAEDWRALVQTATNQDLDEAISTAAAQALVESLKSGVTMAEVSAHLATTYTVLFKARLPEMVQVRAPRTDLTIVSRERLAKLYMTIGKAAESGYFSVDNCCKIVPAITSFFINEGPFFDPSESVHGELLNAAGSFIAAGLDDKATVNAIAGVCDTFLGSKGKPDAEFDRVRVYVVILLAKVAERFPKNDPRRETLLKSLDATLVTPSESVQSAVSDAMALLFPSITDELAMGYGEAFMSNLISGTSLAIRRGAAYGLGALVKGRGSHFVIKDMNVLGRICIVLQDKNSGLEAKQGSLFGLELLARSMGRCFEPYIVKLLDVLISVFADGRTEVREASLEAAQKMMTTVSALGARILLPVLLDLMDSTSWRSKVGAIEWLGAMASLAPRVLARQLPIILPKLVESLADSHHNVQRAAREALYRYGATVRCPEIRALSSCIMDALANPPQYTEKCLYAILHTAFAHVIDGPSLALLEPVLVRGLRDRGISGTETKKRAAQIIGNLATNLVDPRDLVTVLNGLVPALVACLSDPVPEVRAHCGKVLGILIKTVGEKDKAMKGLATDLFSIIGGPFATSVDRAGAAQALAEILAARGSAAITSLLSGEIVENLNSPKPTIREGYVMLVGFLPAAFDAQQKLAELYEAGMRGIIGHTLGLLSDENEGVREAANKTCHSIIARFARIDHLAIFDVLVETLSDSRWRCRLGCLQLFQEFLSKFANAESDPSMEIFAMPTGDELKEGGIDEDRLRLLMCKAFVYRFDMNSSAIRHHALSIWKGLASHPLRAISAILPIFMEECSALIQDEPNEEESREIVYKALEDMICKIGDRLLASILDRAYELLEETPVGALYIVTVSARLLDSDRFPGMNNSLLNAVVPKYINLVSSGLCAAEMATRSQACQLFAALVDSTSRLSVGDVVGQVVEPMLEELLTDVAIDPITLNGLVDLLAADQTGQVFAVTFSKLDAVWKGDSLNDPELASTVCKVITAVFDAVGAEAAAKSVPSLKAIFSSSSYETLPQNEFDSMSRSILAALEADEDSPYQVSLSQLLETLYGENRVSAYRLIRIYTTVNDADFSRFYDIWTQRLLEDIEISEEAVVALKGLLETVSAEGMHALADAVNSGIGRGMPKEIVALVVKNLIVPLLTQTTMLPVDANNRRELGCRMSVKLAKNVGTTAWGNSLTSLIGALIRTASDKKLAGHMELLFEALAECLVNQTALVKPFHPQLQRIFGGALLVEDVREQAVRALTALLPALSRPEPLLQELLSLAETEGEVEVRIAALKVLTATKAKGDHAHMIETAKACMSANEAIVRDAAARWLEAIMQDAELESYRETIESLLRLN